jgi:hypothetical protein
MLPAARRGTGATSLALAATLALALVAVSPAAANTTRYMKGDFQYAKRTATIPFAGSMQATEAEVVPNCEKGWSIAGGGGFPRGLPGHTRLTGTGIGGGRAWAAEAVHLDSRRTTLIGYAICVHDRFVESATHVEAVGVGPTTATDTVSCPDGLSVMGGGVETIGDSENWAINSTLPQDSGSDVDMFPDDVWRDYVIYAGPSPSDFLVEVVCGEDLPSYVSKDVTLADPSPFSTARRTAKCAKSDHVTGGGALISGPSDEAYVLASYPIDLKDKDKAPDDAWRAAGVNTDGSAKTLTTFAICL